MIGRKIVERQYGQDDLRWLTGLGVGDLGAGVGGGAGERGHALDHLPPAGRVAIARPADQVRALDLIKRHRQSGAIDGELNELTICARAISFRAHPV